MTLFLFTLFYIINIKSRLFADVPVLGKRAYNKFPFNSSNISIVAGGQWQHLYSCLKSFGVMDNDFEAGFFVLSAFAVCGFLLL